MKITEEGIIIQSNFSEDSHESSSFRDESGFVFKQEGLFYRAVNHKYKKNYDLLMQSGLYDELIKKNYLVSHQEVNLNDAEPDIYKIILPKQLTFISYSYDWSFSMLKDAALLTLKIQKIALKYGMTLKDASAYNIQFLGSQPVFIDTLSFEAYEAGNSWIGYGQFCRHFLSPLTLMSRVDVSLNQLLVTNIDGIPLDVATKLLPFKSRFNFGLYVHLFLHSKIQQSSKDKKVDKVNNRLSKESLTRLADHLMSTVDKLTWKPRGTEWDAYYDKSVEKDYFDEKQTIVENFLSSISPQKILDLGANEGTFSRIAQQYVQEVFSFDIDPSCVEQNYLSLKKEKNISMTPLVVDLFNPRPSIGWQNTERKSVVDRIGVDTILALALIHHLRITGGIPLYKIARFFSEKCQYLIIEFIPKSDPKIGFLLRNRADVFSDYDEKIFTTTFQQFFEIVNQKKMNANDRVLFLMKKK